MVKCNMSFLNIKILLRILERYAAHKKMNGNSIVWETLEEHTLLCQKYFKSICDHKFIG